MPSIFVITAVRTKTDTVPNDQYGAVPLAWFSKRDDALDSIESNEGDMYEGYYQNLVLEEVPEFQWPHSKVVAWFEWHAESKSWRECDQPEAYEGVCNWAMG